ncbi:MAG: hypothetical protein ACLFTQ_03610 [Candidatus Aenigmatarchaeota archaeon]
MTEENLSERIESLEEKIESHEERISKLEDEGKDLLARKSMTLPEFMRDKEVKHHTDKVLLIGYFFEKYKEKSDFTTKELEEGYKKCGWDLPANLTDRASSLISQGLFDEDKGEEGKKIWSLTRSGVREVQERIK